MRAEKNTLRDKLDQFDYPYREGAWEQFEKIMSPNIPPPVPPAPLPAEMLRAKRKKWLNLLLGTAGAGAVLYAVCLFLLPAKQAETPAAAETFRMPEKPERQPAAGQPEPSNAGAKEKTTRQEDRNDNAGAMAGAAEKFAKGFPSGQTGRGAEPAGRQRGAAPASGRSVAQNTDRSGPEPAPDRQGTNIGQSQAQATDQSSQAGGIPAPGAGNEPATGPDAAAKKAPAQTVADLAVLPPLPFRPLHPDSIPAAGKGPVIRPFTETPLRWKKHEFGLYTDVVGPFATGNYLLGAEYGRDWNRYTQTGLGLSFFYINLVESFNSVRFAAVGTHLIATQYVSLIHRPNWRMRVGVGYRVSLIKKFDTSNSGLEPSAVEPADMRSLVFTGELKRRWRNDYWLGLRFSAVHWSPNLNVYVCRQF